MANVYVVENRKHYYFNPVEFSALVRSGALPYHFYHKVCETSDTKGEATCQYILDEELDITLVAEKLSEEDHIKSWATIAGVSIISILAQ